MISMTSDAAANPELISETCISEARQAVLDEIGARWNKFSEQALSSLTGNYDLVNKIVGRYGLEKTQAQRDVDVLLRGRYI